MTHTADRPSGDLVPAGLEATIVLLRHGQSVLLAEGRFQGQADSPLSDVGLREADLAAERLAHRTRSPALPLPQRPPLEIVHSPLMRTTETAGRVAAAMTRADQAAGGGSSTPPLRREPALAEIAQGRWEGVLRSQIETDDAELLAAWRSRPLDVQAPGGERVVDVAVRVRGAIERALANLAAADPGVGVGVGVAPAGAVAATPGAGAATRSPSVAPDPAAAASVPLSGYPVEFAADRPWTLIVGHDGVFKVLLLTLFDLPLERYWSFPFALCGITIIELRDRRAILRTHNSTQHLAPLAGG